MTIPARKLRISKAGRAGTRAFTLIELLVVITIIVVLLALLSPALHSAIYQTQLTVCGAQQHTMVVGVMQYAFANKRWYPYKTMVHEPQYWSVASYQTHNGNTKPYGAAGSESAVAPPPTPQGHNYDYRPMIQDYYNFNKLWKDPLAGNVDFGYQANHWDAMVLSSYNLYDSWKYYATQTRKRTAHGRGMMKLGDYLEFRENRGGQVVIHRFNVLVADIISLVPDTWSVTGHPDRNGEGFALQQRQNSIPGDTGGSPEGSGLAIWKGTYTHYNYFGYSAKPWGAMDANYGMSDGSVSRVDNIPPPRLAPHFDDDHPVTPIPSGNESDTVGFNREFLLEGR